MLLRRYRLCIGFHCWISLPWQHRKRQTARKNGTQRCGSSSDRI